MGAAMAFAAAADLSAADNANHGGCWESELTSTGKVATVAATTAATGVPAMTAPALAADAAVADAAVAAAAAAACAMGATSAAGAVDESGGCFGAAGMPAAAG